MVSLERLPVYPCFLVLVGAMTRICSLKRHCVFLPSGPSMVMIQSAALSGSISAKQVPVDAIGSLPKPNCL